MPEAIFVDTWGWMVLGHLNAFPWLGCYADGFRTNLGSLTDLTSMTVMEELGLTEVLTEDDHFIQVGMGFQKIP